MVTFYHINNNNNNCNDKNNYSNMGANLGTSVSLSVYGPRSLLKYSFFNSAC